MTLKIGPFLTVCRDEYIPNMVDAFVADNENGSHHLNNKAAEKLKAQWPTLLAMAELIEKQRDALLAAIQEINYDGDGIEEARSLVVKIKQGQY